MKVTLAQVNPTIGDLEGNVQRCVSAVQAALTNKPDLILFPELAIPGCHPRDILYDPSFNEAVFAATKDFATRTQAGPPVIIGTLHPSNNSPPNHPGLYNAAVLLNQGEVHLVAGKQLLQTHDAFYEPRWFLPGPPLPPITVAGKRIGVLFGGDLVDNDHTAHPAADLLSSGADILVCLAASPYHHQILKDRLEHARQQDRPIVYLNLCGANDEIIYDGRSFALDKHGELLGQLTGFQEEVCSIDMDMETSIKVQDLESEEELYQALVLGVRDFMEKNRLEHAFLGLSGGVDSAVVAAIAAEAVGPENVIAIAIPSRYSDPRSTYYAKELAETLGIGFEVVDLEALHLAAENTLGELLETGIAGENIQPRLRTMILMSYVNHYGGVLINTTNKTEASLGYGTLYGDTAGTLCPIADLTKLEVFSLAHWINRKHEIIPAYILTRPPTAELKPDQVDPFDYAQVSPELEALVKLNRSNLALRTSEHKRWQMGVVLKVSEKAFGTGRMIPITRK